MDWGGGSRWCLGVLVRCKVRVFVSGQGCLPLATSRSSRPLPVPFSAGLGTVQAWAPGGKGLRG